MLKLGIGCGRKELTATKLLMSLNHESSPQKMVSNDPQKNEVIKWLQNINLKHRGLGNWVYCHLTPMSLNHAPSQSLTSGVHSVLKGKAKKN